MALERLQIMDVSNNDLPHPGALTAAERLASFRALSQEKLLLYGA